MKQAIRKPAFREKFFVFTGFTEDKGKTYLMADKKCSCGGRGYNSVLKPNGQKPIFNRCKCVRTTSLSIGFIILDK